MAAGFYRYVLHGDLGSHWGHTPFLAPQELAGLPSSAPVDLALMFLFVPLGELFIDRNNFFTAGALLALLDRSGYCHLFRARVW